MAIHKKLLNSVLRAPLLFFDTYFVANILNRFSKDCVVVDEVLPNYIFGFLTVSFVFLLRQIIKQIILDRNNFNMQRISDYKSQLRFYNSTCNFIYTTMHIFKALFANC